MSITDSESVFVVLGTQRAMRSRHIVVCGPSRFYYSFPHFLIKARFSKKKVFEHKMCVLIFSTNFF